MNILKMITSYKYNPNEMDVIHAMKYIDVFCSREISFVVLFC